MPAGTACLYLWAAVRLRLGWTFLWPFLDKTFGLGHETATEGAWINGGSPTSGFLSGASGPSGDLYESLSGVVLADWGFMLGLLCIGVASLLGIGTRIAAIAGALLLVLMWTASLPPSNNPFMDDHIIYALVLIGLAHLGAGSTLGFGPAGPNSTSSSATRGSAEPKVTDPCPSPTRPPRPGASS